MFFVVFVDVFVYFLEKPGVGFGGLLFGKKLRHP